MSNLQTQSEELLFLSSIALAAAFITNGLLSSLSVSPSLPSLPSLPSQKKEQPTHLDSPGSPFKNTLIEELQWLDSSTCEVNQVDHLASHSMSTSFPQILSPLIQQFQHLDAFITRDSYILSECEYSPQNRISSKWMVGGPRKCLFFKPTQVRPVIVTCGGLCPGLNAVIREIVQTLINNYKVDKVEGVCNGYKGFYSEEEYVELSLDRIQDIHHQGGTILGSSRGGFDLKQIVDTLSKKGINQVYVIGGDGTQKGVLALFNEIKTRHLQIGICGIPKTIDNDIPLIDKSFGFETAVEEAMKAIKSAWVESHSAEYGVGLVRLMGRHAGYIAMEASSASRDVNICLVPEFQFELQGQKGFLNYVYTRLQKKGHIVIVVAEGADRALKDASLGSLGKDLSGNMKSGDIGLFLKQQIISYCKSKDMSVALKYIDPTYMIRSVQPNYHDKELLIISQLAQTATHGLMAGFTGFAVGHINNNLAMIPQQDITDSRHTNSIQPRDRHWQRLLASTGQPSFLNQNQDTECLLIDNLPENKHLLL